MILTRPPMSGIIGPSAGSDPFFANVVLLTHCDGVDGSTTVIDEVGHTLTCVNQAQLDTAQKKFGTASIELDGTDYVSAADSVDWAFGLDPWTIECWVRWRTNTAAFHYILGQWNPPNSGNVRSWAIDNDNVNPPTLELRLSANGTTNTLKAEGVFDPVVDTWYATAADWDGTTYRLYLDGAVLASATTGITLFDSTGLLAIGSGVDGWIDEVRITKGVARYAGAYTPAVVAFPNS